MARITRSYLPLPRPLGKPALDAPPRPLPPEAPLPFGGGDLGRNASILSVQPVVLVPEK